MIPWYKWKKICFKLLITIVALRRDVPLSHCPGVLVSQCSGDPLPPVSRCPSVPMTRCPSVPVFQWPSVPVTWGKTHIGGTEKRTLGGDGETQNGGTEKRTDKDSYRGGAHLKRCFRADYHKQRKINCYPKIALLQNPWKIGDERKVSEVGNEKFQAYLFVLNHL